jgi:hypothetical protein
LLDRADVVLPVDVPFDLVTMNQEAEAAAPAEA